MAEHEVKLIATEGLFRGLAKQNMLFHQCICELVDNAIAATPRGEQFAVKVIFDMQRKDPNLVDVWVVDNASGMGLDRLGKALQLGESATTINRLNEHGFGLKNALATLSRGCEVWTLWTVEKNSDEVCLVTGPFNHRMTIKSGMEFPVKQFLPREKSTIIKVPVTVKFIRTVQGRGAPTNDLVKLRDWLIEHLGVHYRGYLDLDDQTGEISGRISVSIRDDTKRVKPIVVPMAVMRTEHFTMELDGRPYPIKYRYGTLVDENERKRLSVKFYYQGNMATQGIDIRLGKRVIATRQIENIWKNIDAKKGPLARDNHYNEFVGELLIPELPRGILSTTNNKTDFNLGDSEWEKIFAEINQYRPPKDIRETSETALKKEWMKRLKAVNPDDVVADEISVWPTGTNIDVYQKTASGRIIIYELKVGAGQPIHLYQLKMYWDGLVLKGEKPDEAILLVGEARSALHEMAKEMNEKLTPPQGTRSYAFRIETLQSKGLLPEEEKGGKKKRR